MEYHVYLLPKSLWFDLFADGKYSLLFLQKVDAIFLIFLFMLFQTSGNMVFSAVTVLNKICPSLVDIRIFDKVILENGGMLLFIPHGYNFQAMYNKAVDSYGHAL